MNTKLIALVLTSLLLLPLSGNADNARSKVLEDGREVIPSMLTLPTLADGLLAIQGCSSCKRIPLQLARETRFYVGKTEVNYADLQRHLRAHPNVSVLVVSPRGQKIVTRIVADQATPTR
jgi:hypothetical protein